MQEAKYLAADAERKYEEVARKLNMMENDLDKALLKADNSENKIIDLEMELKVVGDNMKCMEVIFTITQSLRVNLLKNEFVETNDIYSATHRHHGT